MHDSATTRWTKVKGEGNYNNKNHSSKKLLNFTRNDEMGMSL